MGGKRKITGALRALLRPVVRLLVEFGFSARDLMEVIKTLYVEVASEDFGLRGRPANLSRVAILTGLSRREVARLRKVLESDPLEVPAQETVVAKVLSAWHEDPRYVDSEHQPLRLPLRGDGSLVTLVDQHRGDIPGTALIKELQRVHAISVNEDVATVLVDVASGAKLDEEVLERFTALLHEVSNALGRNLPTSTGDDGSAGRTSGRGSMYDERLRRFLDDRAERFLQDVQGWLGNHAETSRAIGGLRLGVGVYPRTQRRLRIDPVHE
jgi:hypothetical protein